MTLTWSETSGGSGTWPEAETTWGYIAGSTADVNGDGFEDLIVMEGQFPDFPDQPPPDDHAHPMHFFINDGSGNYTDQTAELINGDVPQTTMVSEIFFDDFNGDGFGDILIFDSGWDGAGSIPGEGQDGAENVLLLGTVNGTYDIASDQLGGGVRTSGKASYADVDGDGDLDLFDLASTGTGSSASAVPTPVLLINDGSGNFTENTGQLPGMVTSVTDTGGGLFMVSNWLAASEMTDLNGDGAAELIVGQFANQGPIPEDQRSSGPIPGEAVVYWNDGTGNFSDSDYTALPSTQWGSDADITAFEVRDFNGDGHTDVLTLAADGVNYGGYEFILMQGDGRGGLTDVTATAFPLGSGESDGPTISELRIVDLELDGDLDIVGLPDDGFEPDGRPVVWLNDGSGVFTETVYWSDVSTQPRFSDVVLSPDGNGYNFVWYGIDPASNYAGWYTTVWATHDLTVPREIEGGDGFDHIIGGLNDEVISGFGGRDVIFGQDGDDDLRGGAGDDELDGGTGDDVAKGQDGNDVIAGGDGRDLLMGHGGNDTLKGGQGGDTLEGGDGRDSLNGHDNSDDITAGKGKDTAAGGKGDDTINGGDGNDDLSGGDGADEIVGGRGDDTIDGGNGQDDLSGADGADSLLGGNKADILRGETGGDVLKGGKGADTLRGGDGRDTLDGGDQSDEIKGGKGNDLFIFSGGKDTISDFDATSGKEDIDLSGVASITGFNDLKNNHMSQAGADVVISDLNGNTLTLTGVLLDELDKSDFQF